MGARHALTPKPHIIMKGNHGIPVPACKEIKYAAVALNTGAPHAQMNGNEYIFAGFGAFICSVTAVIASAVAAALARASWSTMIS